MIKFTGKGVNNGIAIGKISIFEHKTHNITKIRGLNIENELKRFKKAKNKAKEKTNLIYEKALSQVDQRNAEIFKIHIMMLDDEDFNRSIVDIISDEHCNAEYAVHKTEGIFSKMFLSMDSDYMNQRADDVKDISKQLLCSLEENHTDTHKNYENSILCADELTPGETVDVCKQKILAFATAKGSLTSHTTILAKNMDIPAVIGLGDEFLSAVKDGDILIVDASKGEVILNPDEATVKSAKRQQLNNSDMNFRLQQLKGLESVTLDDRKLRIYANIGSLSDVTLALENDTEGVGLFRSEFLYLENDDFPTEEQQFEIYKKVLTKMKGKEVIIRTLDIGADKQLDYFKLDKEPNPALGLRAIRICLTKPEIFKTQLRALYRASYYGNLSIMFPMITSTDEVEKTLKICEEVKSELDEKLIKYNKHTKLGIMIETPAAALISDRLAPLVDFFSIGTNDLTQYTLACDRQNALIEPFCDTHHKAVLRLIKMTVKNAHDNNISVGICGELGSDSTLTESFIKMGIDEISVSPSCILKLRDKVRSIKL